MRKTKSADIDEYIAGFPANIQQRLKEIRALIKKAAPDAKETIKYSMPTFTLNGNLVHFATFNNHIGFYPVPTQVEAFKKALEGYKTGKNAIQFPFDRPIPAGLITKIVKFRIKKNLEKALLKKQQYKKG